MKKQENIFHIVTHLQGVHVSDYSSFPIVESCFPSLHWPDLCYLKTICEDCIVWNKVSSGSGANKQGIVFRVS